jgi:hypothetical protein
MHHIVYLSWATVPFTDKQLQELLVPARRRNMELGITGILLYGNECFLQLLEGEEDVVQELYAHIRRDVRHDTITAIANKAVAQRLFPDWAMAFQLTSARQLDTVVSYLGSPQVAVNTAGLLSTDQHLFDLLRAFVLP